MKLRKGRNGEGKEGGEEGRRAGGSVGRRECVALGRLQVSLEEDVNITALLRPSGPKPQTVPVPFSSQSY